MVIRKIQYVFFVVFLLYWLGCQDSAIRVPRVKERNVGTSGKRVKRIVTYGCDRYFADESPFTIDKNSCEIATIEDFDLFGNSIKFRQWIYFDYPDEPDCISVMKVDEDGNIIERTAKMRENNGERNSYVYNNRWCFSYNEKGFETELVYFHNGKLSSRFETIYDEYNCPIKKLIYDENNKLLRYYINTFDNKNREISSLQYDDKNELVWKDKREYGDGDEWIVEYTYNGKKELVETRDKREYTDVQYYSNGKIKSKHYFGEPNRDRYTTYDYEGRIIEIKTYFNDEWEDTEAWKYREDGALIEKSESSSRFLGKPYYKKTTYYRCNSNGGWVEIYTIDSEGNVIGSGIREIEYY